MAVVLSSRAFTKQRPTGNSVTAMASFAARVIPAAAAALLISCGGGADQSVPSLPEKISIIKPPPEATPFFIRDLPSGIQQEPPKNSDSWSYAVRHQGGDILSVTFPQSAETVQKTGLQLNEAVALRGNGRGSFFRAFNNQFESYIDTSSNPYREVIGGGPHTAVSYTFHVQPAVVDTVITADISIPFVEATGHGVGQLSIFGYMTDGSTIVAFVFGIFDNRPVSIEPMVMSDTYFSFVSQAIDDHRYAVPNTVEPMVNHPFNGYRRFGARFTAETLKNMIQDINENHRFHGIELVSEDPAAYKFISVGMLHEVSLHDESNNVLKMGVSFKNFQAYKLQ